MNSTQKNSKHIIFRKKKSRKEKYESIEPYMKSTNFPLYDYQKIGLDWLLKRELVGYKTAYNTVFGGLLCDEPGLGKTIQICAALYCNPLKHTLIVLPNSVIQQWIDTIKKILPSESIYFYHGTNRCKTVAELKLKKFKILITTYGMLYSKKDTNESTILHNFGYWDRIVFDEVHILRNKKSIVALSACRLKGNIRWGLTGTPIQNSEKDLYSLYKFLEIPKNYFNTICAKVINKSLILRRTKDEFKRFTTKFPNLNQINHLLEFNTDKERNIYRKLQQNLLEDYFKSTYNKSFSTGGGGHSGFMIIELLLRLRQLSLHPQILINSLNRKFDSNISKFTNNSTKISKLMDIIKNTKDEYCLVFCHFKEEIKLIGNELKNKNIGFLIYDGSTSLREREAIIKMYPPKPLLNRISYKNNLPKKILENIQAYFPKVLLIQIKAGGVGLNLQQFSQLFILSPDWNPSNEIQAIARSHRLGQHRAVNVHRFLLFDKGDDLNKCKFSTIDEHISSVQNDKRHIMADILEDDRYINTNVYNDLTGLKQITDY